MQAPSNENDSIVLAQVEEDVGVFSIGDVTKGEKRLIMYIHLVHLHFLFNVLLNYEFL